MIRRQDDGRSNNTLQNEESRETEEPLLGPSVVQPTIMRQTTIPDIPGPIKEVSPGPEDRDVCAELMGNWGRWQLRAVSIIYLTKIQAAWFMACIIFTAPALRYQEYSCNLVEFTSRSHPDLDLYHPLRPYSEGQFDFCKVYNLREKLVAHNATESKFYPGNNTLIPCRSFNYSIPKDASLITQYDLVCSKTIWVAITQCFHLFGVLLGGVAGTMLMDFYSPRRVMLIGMFLLIPFGVATGYAPWLWLHIVFRCLAACFCAVIFTPGGAIFSDIVGGRYKTYVSANFEHFWSIAVILLPLVGWLTNTWAQIYLTITFPAFLMMFLWQWVPDSPRWHLEKGNIERAKAIIKKAARMNKEKKMIPDNLDELLKHQALIIIGKKTAEVKNGYKHLLSLPGGPIRVFLIFFSWSFIFTSYYGSLLNIRSFGREHLYMNTAIAGVCEVIGGVIGFLILLFVKRKFMWTGIFTCMTGLVTFAIWLLPTKIDGNHMLLDLLMVGMVNKVGISACCCVLTVCTAELFPVMHRKRVVFGATVVTRIVFITAPLIGFLAMYGDGVPLCFFGVMSFLSGFCLLFLTPMKLGVQDPRPKNIPMQQVWSIKTESSHL